MNIATIHKFLIKSFFFLLSRDYFRETYIVC